MTIKRHALLPLLLGAVSLGAGIASAGAIGDAPRGVGVIVDTTAGPAPAVVADAQTEVARLRARGVDAQLRVTRSPSETTAAAATLVTRGAATIVLHGAGAHAVVDPLRQTHPSVRLLTR